MSKNISSEADISKYYNAKDFNNRIGLYDMLKNSPIPDEEIMNNIGLFLDRRILSRFLFIQELYEQIIPIHGSIFEFGVRYGQNLSLFTSLRGIHEPYNYNRKIVGFDTWEGFLDVHSKDDKKRWKKGDFAVPEGYEIFLENVLLKHEQMAPIETIKKFELVKGDASIKVKDYLKNHQETIISLAYFDFDIYQPTRDCLEAIIPYLSKGAIIGFDEINVPEWPGETAAMRELLGSGKFRIVHSKYRANAGYIVYE